MPSPESSRDRLLRAGKNLFATRGYENTSTIMIARAAGTSESQLMKHFGSKDGLLEAIFEQGWAQLAAHLDAVRQTRNAGEKLRMVIVGTMEALEGDPELKELMLLEARRVRKQGGKILLTRGYRDFMTLVDSVLREMQTTGQLRPDVQPEVLRSALIGMAEGMLRDEMLARRMGTAPPFGFADMLTVVDNVLPTLTSRNANEPQPERSAVKPAQAKGAPRQAAKKRTR